jgi:NAD-dependent DNA ligase
MPDHNARPHSAVNPELRAQRAINEMLDLCRGVIYDGEIAGTEARSLAQWVRNHPDIADIWPASVVARRLARIFVDGMIMSDERAALRDLLEQVLCADPVSASAAEWSGYLGFDHPAPPIVIPGKRFCFVGKFFFGTRAACRAAVVDRGGTALDTVQQDLDYVVIGLLGSPTWVRSVEGAEIQKAMNYRAMGLGPAIVSEERWAEQLGEG